MKQYFFFLKSVLISLFEAKPKEIFAAVMIMFGTKEGRILAIYRPAMMVACFFALLIVSGKVLAVTGSIIACLVSVALLLYAFNWVLTSSKP